MGAEGEVVLAEPRLLKTSLMISPTRRQVGTLPRAVAEWRIAPATAAKFEEVLVAGRFSPAVAAELAGRLVISADTGEGLIIPDAALLDLFRPAERVLWWAVLAQHSANLSYRWPLEVRRAAVDDLAGEPEFAAAAQSLRAWGVVRGNSFLFGDLFALEDLFSSEESRGRFLQILLSAESLFVRVQANRGEGGDSAADWGYWQNSGRSRSVESLLNATQHVEGRERIDVSHLLPRLARSLLHTFPPDFSEMGEPSVENAVVAATFAAPDFDSRALLESRFSEWLAANADRVEGRRSFGDIVVFDDPQEKRWPFTMVYICDGILFGRRPSLCAPWELLHEAELAQAHPRLRGGAVATYRIRSASRIEAPTPGAAGPGFVEPKRIALTDLPSGPWGRLKAYELLLSPSTELLERQPPPEKSPKWTFAGVGIAEIRRVIGDLDAPAEVRSSLQQLFEDASPNHRGLITVSPSVALVRATPAVFRERLFRYLVHGAVATDYVQETVIATRKPPEVWLPPGALPEDLRRVVLDLVYRRGDGLVLSDFGALYHAAPDPATRHQLLRTVYASPTLVMLLERPEPAEIPGLVDYWRIDQQKSVGGLLRSFADAEDMAYLDVVHLVPPLAREMMNVYMHVLADVPVPSCYWTALNFSAERPDSRLLTIPRAPGQEHRIALAKLQKEYEPADTAAQLGDVVVYRRRSDGELLHLCTFVAADVVYTKNGFGFSSPWCLMYLADVDALYLRPGEVERLVFRPRESG